MNSTKPAYYSKLIFEGILNSYTQIYFSKNKALAFALIIVSFFDLSAGLSGLLAILITQLTAILFNFNHHFIRDGSYSYNTAMVGIGIGIFYTFNISLLVLLIIASILTFFLTIWFSTHLAQKGLPFLSIPFLIVTWLVILGGQNFSAMALQTKSVLSLEQFCPQLFSYATQMIGSWPLADQFHLYFRSMGAILFQYNDLSGIIIAVAILCASRMTFMLSLYGYLLGFLFYKYMEADFSTLIYSYIGFNFILTAIALGGFFIVASRRSMLLLLFSIPVIALLISSLHGLFASIGLPMYSLPFNLVVLLILYAINQRTYAAKLIPVKYQHSSVEINHYKYYNFIERYKRETLYQIALPFMGHWNVSQGHSGKITHTDDYRFAWDFDIRNENNKTYNGSGTEVTDFLCYDLPVIAPAAGYVTTIIDQIDDNAIGQVDLINNWGNTIIIKHNDYLYSKLCHLKKGSFKVQIGDYVFQGQPIANCGNSGRSPEPHLHFQMQATPYVASKTIYYPLSYYLEKTDNKLTFKTFDIPEEGKVISNPIKSNLLSTAFQFIPGKTIKWSGYLNNKKIETEWEIYTNSENRSYIYCADTKSTAYFVNSGILFFFTDFYGKKNSLLHHFYKAAYKIILGCYVNTSIDDTLQITDTLPKSITHIHDFTAPLFHYLKVKYSSEIELVNNIHNPSHIAIKANAKSLFFSKTISKSEYVIDIEQKENLIITFTSKDEKLNVQSETKLF
ncbi:MAG: urea transporter [Salinivirgaceae bacterium]|nr:urea transporter [Salinivirgaceae bacterium]MDY0281729.1 urea transporter [Salinivirgaceae bacterium]